MDFDHDHSPQRTRAVFREFALACRAERDRLAVARMAEEDRRFEASMADRAIADLIAARLIAAAAQP